MPATEDFNVWPELAADPLPPRTSSGLDDRHRGIVTDYHFRDIGRTRLAGHASRQPTAAYVTSPAQSSPTFGHQAY